MAATDDLIPDFDDFERYRNGEMQPAEQRSLEGRMLSEPLVAEAYEGFLAWRAQHADPARIPTDLRKRLRDREARTNVLPLWAYASAACVLLVLFVYWAVFWDDQKMDAKKQKVAASQKAMSPSTRVQAPAQAGIQPPVKDKSAAFAPAAPKAAAPTAHISEAKSGQAAKAPRQRKKELPAASLADIQVPQETTDIAIGDSFWIETQVVQVPSQAPKALEIPSGPQAVGKSTAGSVRMEPSSFKSTSKDAPKPDTQRLAEMLVLTKPEVTRKKSAAPMAILAGAPAPVPADGWPFYRTYLDKHTGSAPLDGQVTVTFVVGSLGSLSGFVARGPEQLQKEAIRMIQEGPAWVPARTEGRTVPSLAEIRLQFRQAP